MRNKSCALILIGVLALAAGACAPFSSRGVWRYPVYPRGDTVDDYHGTRVPDPYRELENAQAEDTRAWVAAENAITEKFVDTPDRAAIHDRLRTLIDKPGQTVPVEAGGRLFFKANSGLQNQSPLFVQPAAGGEPRLLIDPNTWTKDGAAALVSFFPSRDGKKLAYLRSDAGSDWQEIHILDVDSGRESSEVLRHCKFSSVAWHPNGTGFYYSRFPDPDKVAAADRNFYNRVVWHELGTPQSADVMVYERPDDKMLGFAPGISEDGRYLVLGIYRGTDPKTRIYYRELSSDGPFSRLFDTADASYTWLENIGSTVYVSTDRDAPRGRIVEVDLDNPAPAAWREVVPQREKDVIYDVVMVNNRFVVNYMHDAHHILRIYDLNGKMVQEVPLPGLGSVKGVQGKREGLDFYFYYTSFLVPWSVYHYSFETGRATLRYQPPLAFDPKDYETRQVFYASKDGTRVPMFITHKRGLAQDGQNPTLLYGYGGFNVSLTPTFSASRIMWLEQGGVYALANLRGGGEYGREWHEAGILDKKQNVFDDFIAAAEWLIAEKYTSSAKLAIMGGSNGGLLTAACMIQRPELFGAVVSLVPVTDMLRYQTFTVGKYWESDYGNAAESADQFKFLYAYSPLHNVKAGQAYPPTLVTTADTDNRVVPAHAKKFVAALQALDGGENPLLLRVETRAGHGGGKPTTKAIDEAADVYAFIFRALGMHYQKP